MSSFKVIFLYDISVKFNNIIKENRNLIQVFGNVHFHQKPTLYKQETGNKSAHVLNKRLKT